MRHRRKTDFKPGDRVQINANVWDMNQRDFVGGRLCEVLATGNGKTEHETLALLDVHRVLVVVLATQVTFIARQAVV